MEMENGKWKMEMEIKNHFLEKMAFEENGMLVMHVFLQFLADPMCS